MKSLNLICSKENNTKQKKKQNARLHAAGMVVSRVVIPAGFSDRGILWIWSVFALVGNVEEILDAEIHQLGITGARKRQEVGTHALIRHLQPTRAEN
jgi:hypothetical protein